MATSKEVVSILMYLDIICVNLRHAPISLMTVTSKVSTGSVVLTISTSIDQLDAMHLYCNKNVNVDEMLFMNNRKQEATILLSRIMKNHARNHIGHRIYTGLAGRTCTGTVPVPVPFPFPVRRAHAHAHPIRHLSDPTVC